MATNTLPHLTKLLRANHGSIYLPLLTRGYSTGATPYQKPQMYLNPNENQTIKLPDGRTMGFAEYGKKDGGKPLFWFHGTPSCRFEGYELEETANKLGVKIISPDRPGFGLSTFQQGRTLMDYPKDIEKLAEHLNLDSFHIMGGSGGGPYVIACANYFDKKTLPGSGIVAGLGPRYAGMAGQSLSIKLAFNLRVWFPSLMKKISETYFIPLVNDPDPTVFIDKFMSKMIAGLPQEDQDVVNKDAVRFAESFREAMRPGAMGQEHEIHMFIQDWGIKFEDVDSNLIRIYWGDKDVNVSRRGSEYMAKHLKNANLTIMPGETHYTICDRQGERMIREVMEQ